MLPAAHFPHAVIHTLLRSVLGLASGINEILCPACGVLLVSGVTGSHCIERVKPSSAASGTAGLDTPRRRRQRKYRCRVNCAACGHQGTLPISQPREARKKRSRGERRRRAVAAAAAADAKTQQRLALEAIKGRGLQVIGGGSLASSSRRLPPSAARGKLGSGLAATMGMASSAPATKSSFLALGAALRGGGL